MSGEFLKHKSKILLIGGSGTLGLAILKSNFFNKQIISPKKKNLNLLNKKQIKKYLNQNFDIILNCSGFSRIRLCEKNKSKSFKRICFNAFTILLSRHKLTDMHTITDDLHRSFA